MRPLMVVIEQKLPNNIPQLLVTGKDEMVEAFPPESFDKRFNVSVLLRTERPCPLCLASGTVQNTGEATSEQRIIVVNQVFIVAELPVDAVHLIAGNLSHEVSIGFCDDATAPDLPCRDVLE